ncbi:unnamed protein product [Boreogadus saida]
MRRRNYGMAPPQDLQGSNPPGPHSKDHRVKTTAALPETHQPKGNVPQSVISSFRPDGDKGVQDSEVFSIPAPPNQRSEPAGADVLVSMRVTPRTPTQQGSHAQGHAQCGTQT